MAGHRIKNILKNAGNLYIADGRQFFADAFSGMERPFFQQNITGLSRIAQSGINGYDEWLLVLLFYFVTNMPEIQGVNRRVQCAVDVRRRQMGDGRRIGWGGCIGLEGCIRPGGYAGRGGYSWQGVGQSGAARH